MAWLLTPAQLFHPDLWKKQVQELGIKQVILWEDPTFFGDRRGDAFGRPILKLNRLRLAYLRACCDAFCQEYKVDCVHVDSLWEKPIQTRYASLKEVHLFDPCDRVFEQRLEKYVDKVVYYPSPQWLASQEQLEQYSVGKKRLMHHHFYEWMKKSFPEVHQLNKVKSQDVYNRNPLTEEAIRNLEEVGDIQTKAHRKWIQQAVEWVNGHKVFKNYPGADQDILLETLANIAITHKEARDWLKDFIQNRFASFGEYQDAMYNTLNPRQRYLYHSGISPMINNGLLIPREVLEAVKVKGVNVATYEGFVRQILGWREYCRLYYRHFTKTDIKKNVFQSQGRLPKEWYQISEGNMIQNTIAKAWRTGYLHHIERLMIMANWMNLHQIKPDEVYNWFYEFALDSYSWVMVFNVYSMGTWNDGGLAMRKPYISSSSYLIRMGRFSPKEDWVDPWDQSYHTFIKRNRPILKHTVLANLV
jgi:deoxyribodipyrimidine photolyase-related protein